MATVRGVAKSQTRLSDLHTHSAVSVCAYLHVCYRQRHQSTAPATEQNPAPDGSNAQDEKLPAAPACHPITLGLCLALLFLKLLAPLPPTLHSLQGPLFPNPQPVHP